MKKKFSKVTDDLKEGGADNNTWDSNKQGNDPSVNDKDEDYEQQMTN